MQIPWGCKPLYSQDLATDNRKKLTRFNIMEHIAASLHSTVFDVLKDTALAGSHTCFCVLCYCLQCELSDSRVSAAPILRGEVNHRFLLLLYITLWSEPQVSAPSLYRTVKWNTGFCSYYVSDCEVNHRFLLFTYIALWSEQHHATISYSRIQSTTLCCMLLFHTIRETNR